LLANERTFLAYLRAGVTLILAGATFIHFGSDQWLAWLGIACVPIGVFIMVIGALRYRAMKREIATLRKQLQH
jgi:putative membrane protein